MSSGVVARSGVITESVVLDRARNKVWVGNIPLDRADFARPDRAGARLTRKHVFSDGSINRLFYLIVLDYEFSLFFSVIWFSSHNKIFSLCSWT